MPTLAQLQDEPWWDREIVTTELDWFADELCRRTGRPRTAAGTKGNEAHLRGAHRSQEWILRSSYCTSRTYTVQTGLTDVQARHIGGMDFVPGVWGTAANRALVAEQTRRLVDAAKAGRLPGVREIIGTLGGRTVYGYRVATGQTFAADISHLDHWHLTLDRRRLTDRAVMERILAVALGEDEDMTPEQAAQLAELHKLATVGQRTGAANDTPAHVNQTYGGGIPILWWPRQWYELRAEITALRTAVEGIAGGDPDVLAILAGVDERLAALKAGLIEDLPDAVADEERDRLAE